MLTTYTNATRESERGYYAFGSDRRVAGTPATDHRFTGQKVDGSGLYYYNARYYDPVIGQFVSPDTIVPVPGRVDGYNRYMYVLGNPLRYNDPTGHCQQTPDDDDAACWHALQRLLHSPNSAGIYMYDEAKAWDVDQIEMLTEFWSQNDFGAMNPDARALGANYSYSWSTTSVIDLGLVAGAEVVQNSQSGEVDLYVYGGGQAEISSDGIMAFLKDPFGGISGRSARGQGSKVSVYTSEIFNAPTNDSYTGRTEITEYFASYGLYGGSYAQFNTPGNPDGPHGTSVGWSPGVGVGRTDYQMYSIRLRDVWNTLVDTALTR